MPENIVSGYHTDLKDWEKSLRFYLDEMNVFEKRLTEVIQKNTSTTIRAEVEHFQNQLIVQKEHFDVIKDDIHREVSVIRNAMEFGARDISDQGLSQHEALKGRVEIAERIFQETKKRLLPLFIQGLLNYMDEHISPVRAS